MWYQASFSSVGSAAPEKCGKLGLPVILWLLEGPKYRIVDHMAAKDTNYSIFVHDSGSWREGDEYRTLESRVSEVCTCSSFGVWSFGRLLHRRFVFATLVCLLSSGYV